MIELVFLLGLQRSEKKNCVLRNASTRRPSLCLLVSMRPILFRWTTKRFLCWPIRQRRNREWCYVQLGCTNPREWCPAMSRLDWWRRAFDGRSWRHSNLPKRWQRLVQSSCTSLIPGRMHERTNQRSVSPKGLVMATRQRDENIRKLQSELYFTFAERATRVYLEVKKKLIPNT